MPRKKITVPVIFPDGPAATRRSRGKKAIVNARSETGDPKLDGEIWLSRIAMTRQARLMRKNGERDWRRYYRWYEGEQWDDRGGQGSNVSSDNPRETATINKTGSIINSIVPFLINDEIKFLLKARRPEDDVSAEIQQALLNYEWRKRKMTNAMKTCARDMVIIGHCIAKPGYTVEVDESKKPKDDGVINYADYVKRDAPYVERVNPLNFIWDWAGKDRTLNTARWCAEVFFVPYADVVVNKEYDPEVLGMMYSGDYTPTTQTAWETMGVPPGWMKGMQSFALPEDNLVTLIEIWDKKYRKRMIYCDGCPYPLLVSDWPYDYLDGFPYVMAKYIDVPNQPYGLGLPRWIEDQQVQLNRMATLEQDVARKSRPRYKASEQTNPEEVVKFQNGDDIVVGDIQPIPPADLSQMFQVIQANIQRAIEEMTGADRLLQGGPLPSRTTAGEVGTRARLTGLKLDQHVEDFEEFVEDVATQILGHLKKFRTTADVVQVVGLQGAFWHEYTNEDIQAAVDVEVNYFAAPKTDPALEKQSRKEIFQLAISAQPVMAQQGQMVFDIPQLFNWVLQPYNEKDIGRFFKPALVPMPPLEEGQGSGPGAGLPPAMAGALAPAPIPQQPGVGGAPAPTQSDLLMGLLGGIQ